MSSILERELHSQVAFLATFYVFLENATMLATLYLTSLALLGISKFLKFYWGKQSSALFLRRASHPTYISALLCYLILMLYFIISSWSRQTFCTVLRASIHYYYGWLTGEKEKYLIEAQVAYRVEGQEEVFQSNISTSWKSLPEMVNITEKLQGVTTHCYYNQWNWRVVSWDEPLLIPGSVSTLPLLLLLLCVCWARARSPSPAVEEVLLEDGKPANESYYLLQSEKVVLEQ